MDRTLYPDFGYQPRALHASVVLPDQQSIVIMGGTANTMTMDLSEGYSVKIYNPAKHKWETGPHLHRPRVGLCAVLCNGHVYAIGGGPHSMERILVSALDPTLPPATFKAMTSWEKQWQPMPCRFSHGRSFSAATVVQDRWIVIVGGSSSSPKMDIVDTASKTTATLLRAGPEMPNTCRSLGAAVIGNQLYLVGGFQPKFNQTLNRVRSIELATVQDVAEKEEEEEEKNLESRPDYRKPCPLFPPSISPLVDGKLWKEHRTLALRIPRYSRAVVSVGPSHSCLVVAGGFDGKSKQLQSVEVIDTKRRVKYYFPDLSVPRRWPSMVLLLQTGRNDKDADENLRLVVCGGHKEYSSVEFLNVALVDPHEGEADDTKGQEIRR